jgi:hypothetical protein
VFLVFGTRNVSPCVKNTGRVCGSFIIIIIIIIIIILLLLLLLLLLYEQRSRFVSKMTG